MQLAADLDDGTPHKHQRHVMMSALSDFYVTLNGAGDFLNEQENADFEAATYTCLASYAFMATWAMSNGYVRYNIVCKHHLMAHYPEAARCSVNPKLGAAYTEESFISQGPDVHSN